MSAKPGAEFSGRSLTSTVPHKRSVSKEKRRLKLTALGLILLGLWGMLALLLGASVGRETNYRRTLNADLQPGFGETHATRHSLAAGRHGQKDLPPLCVGTDCLDAGQGHNTAYLSPPGYDVPEGVPSDDVDDATSAIGRPHGPETSPPTQGRISDPVPNWLFVPQGPVGGNPGGPGGGNPVPGGPDIGNPPQNPNDTPPSDFTQPPFSNPPGPDAPAPTDPGPGPSEPGPNGPGPSPDAPPNGGAQPDPQQLPEPLTLSLFAAGLAGAVLLRRRRDHSSK